MNYFPMFMDIRKREILLCGGGVHALEKLERLLSFGPCIRIISPKITPETQRAAEAFHGAMLERRFFEKKDLDRAPVFVIAAEEREENVRIVNACRERNIPVNAVDMQDLCDFIFPAMLTSEHSCIGISTGGLSPAAAVELKRNVAEAVPEHLDDILLWMAQIRPAVRERIRDKTSQRAVLRGLVQEAFRLDRPLTEEEVERNFDNRICF